MSNPQEDIGRDIMLKFAAHLLALLDAKGDVPSATLSVIRQFLSDQSITLAHVRKGDFGDFAKKAAEEFPFNPDGSIRGDSIMGTSTKAN